MPTYTALTTLPGREAAEALGLAMENMVPEPTGVGVFEIEDGSGLWEVGGYFLAPPDPVALSLLEVTFGAKPFAVSELPETDWVAKVKRELAPVRVGRFVLHGSHDVIEPETGQIVLLVEANMAFGTGHHGTTAGCLGALESIAAAGTDLRRIADIGAGSAVLAMAAARVWPEAAVWASDIDTVAVEVAAHNVEVNGLGHITCLEAAGFEHRELAEAAPFDLIFANILMQPLIALAADMAAHLAPSGQCILSGILNEQANDVRAAYEDQGLIVKAQETLGEWTTFCFQKSE